MLFQHKPSAMKLHFLPVLLMACSSCATYQLATINSSIKDEQTKTFTAENDTVKITYAFNGEQGPVQIGIYNKLQTPLYVDWNKSALIVNGDRKSYSGKNAVLSAQVDGTESRFMSSVSQTGTINGTIISNEASGFIPPQAWAKESQLTLGQKAFPLPASTGRDKKKVSGIIVDAYAYTREQSPLTFRSFITLSTHADLSSPVFFDHEFWVSEVVQTSTKPKNFPVQPDRFHIVESKEGTEFLVVAGAVGLAVIMYSAMSPQ